MTDQAAFRAGLLNPDIPVPDGLSGPNGTAAVRRYAVYRNNVTASLIEAMRAAFPLVENLIGEENFSGVSRIYVRAHPPHSPLMMQYGRQFPAFLEGFAPLADVPYLGDAARLDLALRRSYHAADSAPFDPALFGRLSPDALMQARLTLAPATQILRSRFPLFDIWRFNQDRSAPKPRAEAQDVLITRPEFDPVPHLMPAGCADWLGALAEGRPLGEAVDHAASGDDTFDLEQALTFALTAAAFSEIDHKELK